MTKEFDLDIAVELFSSNLQFPIDFDDAWIWAEYSKKDKALKMLKDNFEEGVDFALLHAGEWTQEGRSRDIYGLTLECFKSFCMLAGTPKGKEVRLYFITED